MVQVVLAYENHSLIKACTGAREGSHAVVARTVAPAHTLCCVTSAELLSLIINQRDPVFTPQPLNLSLKSSFLVLKYALCHSVLIVG